MKLIYHPYSPFSRIVFMLAHERSLLQTLTLKKVVVCPVDPYPGWSDNNAYVATFNPIAKIPTLILDESRGDSALFDSRVICEYLEFVSADREDKGVPRGSPLYFAQQAIVAAVMGIMDAEVLCVYEDRIRKPEGLWYRPWYEGMRKKITRGLDFLEQAVQKGHVENKGKRERVELADIAVAVTCGLCEARGLNWREGREGLGRYFDETWKGRRSWVETPVDKEWDKLGVEEEKL